MGYSRRRSRAFWTSAVAAAAAADRLNVLVPILFAIVVAEFLALLDVTPGGDKNALLPHPLHRLAIWFAGVVDVTGNVLAVFPVNGQPAGNLEEILAASMPYVFVGDD